MHTLVAFPPTTEGMARIDVDDDIVSSEDISPYSATEATDVRLPFRILLQHLHLLLPQNVLLSFSNSYPIWLMCLSATRQQLTMYTYVCTRQHSTKQ